MTHDTRESERAVTSVEYHLHGFLSKAIKHIYGNIGGYQAELDHQIVCSHSNRNVYDDGYWNCPSCPANGNIDDDNK